MTASEVAYLCDAANRYFRQPVAPSDVVRTVSGVNLRPRATRTRPARRSLMFDARRRKAPLITMFGGDVTTSRLRAERAVSRLTRFYPMSPRWTAKARCRAAISPGNASTTRSRTRASAGDFCPSRRRSGWSAPMAPALPPCWARPGAAPISPRLRARTDGCRSALSHGARMGAVSDDVLWRRSKLGLTCRRKAREALAAFMAAPP